MLIEQLNKDNEESIERLSNLVKEGVGAKVEISDKRTDTMKKEDVDRAEYTIKNLAKPYTESEANRVENIIEEMDNRHGDRLSLRTSLASK